MPEYIKLAIGDAATFRVREISEANTGKWPDYNFHAVDGKVYTAPKAAMDRQFERAGVSIGQLVGSYITIERAPNESDPKKSWWNMRIASPADAKPAPPTKRLTHAESVGHLPGDDSVPPPSDADNPYAKPAPPALIPPNGPPREARRETIQPTRAEAAQVEESKVDAIANAYRLAWGIAVETQGEFGTPESVQAGAATILIAMGQRGAY